MLALADAIGIKSFLSQRLLTCLVAGAAVFMTGMAAREVAGPRVGLIAAVIAAVYPNYWMNATTGLSETMLLLLVAAVIFASYRFWHRPSLGRAILLGALCASAALTRSEQALLLLVVLIPLALALRGVPLRRRVALAGTGVLTGLLLIAPWVGFNLSRFNQPVFMSDDLGGTLAFANCRPAFYGHALGFGDFKCLYAAQVGSSGDESQGDAHLRRVALHYINAHSNRLPVVVAARVGREFGFYLPLEQIRLDVQLSSRPLVPAWIGLGMYYLLVVGSIYGGVVLRRRRDTLVPFVGLLVEVVVATAVTFGATRYRVPLEVGLVVLSGRGRRCPVADDGPGAGVPRGHHGAVAAGLTPGPTGASRNPPSGHHGTVAEADPPPGVAGHVGVMGGHDDRDGLLARLQLVEERHDLLRARRIEVAGGLVGDDHPGPVGQGPGDGDPLLLAARHPRRQMVQRDLRARRVPTTRPSAPAAGTWCGRGGSWRCRHSRRPSGSG